MDSSGAATVSILGEDGSASFVGGDIAFNADGSAEFTGDITAGNVTFDAGTVDEVNVKTRLANKSALEAIKAAAQDNNTDLAGLKQQSSLLWQTFKSLKL